MGNGDATKPAMSLGYEPDVDNRGVERGIFVVGQAGVPSQVPHMLIVLQVKENVIVKAHFSTYGCPAAVACGQFACEQVEVKCWFLK